MNYIKKHLYGGAIAINVPSNFDDISNIRDVPSHQEVFVDRNSECSIIVELLDSAETIEQGSNLAEYYFNDISEYNCSLSKKLIISEPLVFHSSDLCVSTCFGIQSLEKRYDDKTQKEELNLYILVIRINSVKTDVVISFNNPIVDRSSKPDTESSLKTIKYSQRVVGEIMAKILETFEIKDYELFI
ncbi:Ran GTPase binding protein [Cryptosporidium felis]|nr:Ran GTPase binding protein [Cryptosporidium felis]